MRNLLDQLRADLRFGFRQFTHTPLLTATIVFVLSVGIGVNVAAFTVLHSYITNPVPGVPKNDNLVRLRGTQWSATNAALAYSYRSIPYHEIQEYRNQRTLFTGVAGEVQDNVVLRIGDNADATTVNAIYVTSEYFATLGITPALGPGLPAFSEGDPTAPLVAVIDHRIWRDQFGERSDVVGKTIRVNEATVTIVGVAPPRFAGTSSRGGGSTVADERAIWIPFPAARTVDPTGDVGRNDPRQVGLTAFARLRPGADIAGARAILGAIAARHPTSDREVRDPAVSTVPLLANNLSIYGDPDLPLASALVGLVTFVVLLITCTNVSSLLVGRAIKRRGEMAIRLAMGAARRRIVQQLLVESALLSVCAGVVAVAFIAVLGRLTEGLLEAGFATRVDGTVVGFTFAAALGTSLLFGLAPALHASKDSVAAALKDSSRVARRSRLQQVFVVAQLTLTQPLLVALAVTLSAITAYAPRHAANEIRSRIAVISWAFSGPNQRSARATRDEFAQRVKELPGIVAVAAVGPKHVGDLIIRPGDEAPNGPIVEPVKLSWLAVGPGSFAVADLPLVRGRDFNETDIPTGKSVLVIGSDLAERLWGAADPIGRRLQTAKPRPGFATKEYEVIGVVNVDKAGGSQVAGEYHAYGAESQWGIGSSLHIRTAGPASVILPTARALSRTLAPTIPIVRATTVEAMEADERRGYLQGGAAVGAAGLLILLLASVGLYSVVAFAVAQKRREIGIRMAIGATSRDVVRQFLGSGLRLGALGMLFGLPLSLAAFAFVQSKANGELGNVAVIGLSVAALVTGVALLASVNPARRAAAVNPVIALRAE